MSFDPYQDAREQYEAEIVQEYLDNFGHEVVEEFTTERLRSFYVTHPDVAEPAQEALRYAQSLMPAFSRAALIFAASSVELTLKTVLLGPIVFGLVHTEGLASLITDLTIQHAGMGRFQQILTQILDKFAGVDLRTHCRKGSARTLWQEMKEIQSARNAVIHCGDAN